MVPHPCSRLINDDQLYDIKRIMFHFTSGDGISQHSWTFHRLPLSKLVFKSKVKRFVALCHIIFYKGLILFDLWKQITWDTVMLCRTLKNLNRKVCCTIINRAICLRYIWCTKIWFCIEIEKSWHNPVISFNVLLPCLPSHFSKMYSITIAYRYFT